MGAKIRVDVPGTVRRANAAWNRALPKVAETIMADCNTYCRVDRGTLRESAHLENGGKQIVWDTKYAKKVYYTGTPSHAINPNASLRWCEKAKAAHKGDWVKRANNIIFGG